MPRPHLPRGRDRVLLLISPRLSLFPVFGFPASTNRSNATFLLDANGSAFQDLAVGSAAER